MDGSALVHAAVAAIGASCGKDAAFEAMLCYLLAVHVPLHYRRCARRGRRVGLALAALATAAALVARARIPEPVIVGHWLQRVVIAHIAHETALANQF